MIDEQAIDDAESLLMSHDVTLSIGHGRQGFEVTVRSVSGEPRGIGFGQSLTDALSAAISDALKEAALR